MGTATSRRMEDSDSRESRSRQSDDSSDQDSDLATILQYLIRSGQVHIISSDRDESDVSFVTITPPPLVELQPDTDTLDISEVTLLTKQSCGMLANRGILIPNSANAMLAARQTGINSSQHFSQGDRCRLNNNFLPNKMQRIAAHHNKAFCGTYSEDGNVFLSAWQDRYLRLYQTDGGRFKLFKMVQARDVGWSILDTAFSPDGNYLAYSSWSECIHLCNIHGGQYGKVDEHEALPLSPDDRRFCIFSLVFSADGREILGGANDGYLYIYDRECQQRCLRIEAHEDDINTVAFADRTSQILYSGGDDGLLKVWDRRTLSETDPKPVGILAGHMDGLTYVDPKGDGRHLITNCKDQCIKLWDMRVFSSSDAQENTRKAVGAQNWDYRWQRVPKKLNNPKSHIEGDSSVMTYRGHTVLQTLIRCHFSPSFTTGQRYIYTGCAAGRVVIYDVLTGKIESVLKGHKSCVRDVSWHPYRQEIVSTSWDGTLGHWSYHGSHALDSDDDETVDEGDGTVERPQALRRSRRIAQKRERQKHQQQNC